MRCSICYTEIGTAPYYQFEDITGFTHEHCCSQLCEAAWNSQLRVDTQWIGGERVAKLSAIVRANRELEGALFDSDTILDLAEINAVDLATLLAAAHGALAIAALRIELLADIGHNY